MKISIGSSAGERVGFDLEELLKTRLLIQADSGGGKSWLIRVLAEQLFGKVQVILIDPEGEFATLREKFDYVLVGKGGETPADPRSAALVAHRLLELRASAVCDLYELKHHVRHQWVRIFLDAMVESPKELWRPVVVVVDEAHVFCPEKGKGESEAHQAMVDVCTRGRKRGICPVFATQRLGMLNKDASSNLQNRLIGPTFEDINRKRAAEVLGILKGSDEREFFREIQLLAPGNFYALGRAISKERILVHIRPVETSHPEMGSGKHSAVIPPAPEKIKALLPKLADLPKEAEDRVRTEADFRKEIRDLQTKLKAAEQKQPVPAETSTRADKAQMRTLRAALEDAMKVIAKITAHGFDGAKIKTEEIEQALAKTAHELECMAARAIASRQASFDQVKGEADRILARLEKLLGEEQQINVAVDVVHNEPITIRQTPERCPVLPVAANGFSPAQYRIIQAAASFHAIGIQEISKKWLSARAGASHKSSAYNNNLGALRSRGILDYRNGNVYLTAAGIEAAAPHSQPLTADEMKDSCRELLTPAQRNIFDRLHENYPRSLTREDLAAAAGASPTSSAFNNNLGAMRSAGMIDYGPDRTVVMQKWILLEGNQ
jgi:hypothetical protein